MTVMRVDDPLPTTEQRLLEVWLPFAQSVNQMAGWRLSPAALAALVCAARSALAAAGCAEEARAILRCYHAKQGRSL